MLIVKAGNIAELEQGLSEGRIVAAFAHEEKYLTARDGIWEPTDKPDVLLFHAKDAHRACYKMKNGLEGCGVGVGDKTVLGESIRDGLAEFSATLRGELPNLGEVVPAAVEDFRRNAEIAFMDCCAERELALLLSSFWYGYSLRAGVAVNAALYRLTTRWSRLMVDPWSINNFPSVGTNALGVRSKEEVDAFVKVLGRLQALSLINPYHNAARYLMISHEWQGAIRFNAGGETEGVYGTTQRR